MATIGPRPRLLAPFAAALALLLASAAPPLAQEGGFDPERYAAPRWPVCILFARDTTPATDPFFEALRERTTHAGHWCPPAADEARTVGSTGLALWAFAAFGRLPQAPEHGRLRETSAVRRATAFLEQAQVMAPDAPERGRFGPADALLPHAFATLAFVQIGARTDDPERRERARLAVRHLVATQAPDGTWPAARTPTGDAWASLALLFAQAESAAGALPPVDGLVEACGAALSAQTRRLRAALDAGVQAPVPLELHAAVTVIDAAARWDVESELFRRTWEAFAPHWPDLARDAPSPEALFWVWQADSALNWHRGPWAASTGAWLRARLVAFHDLEHGALPRLGSGPGPAGGDVDAAALAVLLAADFRLQRGSVEGLARSMAPRAAMFR